MLKIVLPKEFAEKSFSTSHARQVGARFPNVQGFHNSQDSVIQAN
jgi:hypothetical protein